MPPHSLHLLQPLDVGCFGPLKRAYRKQVENMIRNSINYITKLEFLLAVRVAIEATFISSNIKGGFRGVGLIPFNLEAVISKLNIQLQTPIPLPTGNTTWEPKTPSNSLELAVQNQLIKEKIACYQDSSSTAINEAVNQFLKGVHTIAHQLVILKTENTTLRQANKLATQWKQWKKKWIQYKGSLRVQDGLDLINGLAVSI